MHHGSPCQSDGSLGVQRRQRLCYLFWHTFLLRGGKKKRRRDVERQEIDESIRVDLLVRCTDAYIRPAPRTSACHCLESRVPSSYCRIDTINWSTSVSRYRQLLSRQQIVPPLDVQLNSSYLRYPPPPTINVFINAHVNRVTWNARYKSECSRIIYLKTNVVRRI